MNRLSQIFLERNPYFCGKISLIGHSLGSLILYDLLSNQFRPDSNDDNKISHTVETESSQIKNFKETTTNVSKIQYSESVEQFLNRIGLDEYKSLFEKEKITIENMVNLIFYKITFTRKAKYFVY